MFRVGLRTQIGVGVMVQVTEIPRMEKMLLGHRIMKWLAAMYFGRGQARVPLLQASDLTRA